MKTIIIFCLSMALSSCAPGTFSGLFEQRISVDPKDIALLRGEVMRVYGGLQVRVAQVCSEIKPGNKVTAEDCRKLEELDKQFLLLDGKLQNAIRQPPDKLDTENLGKIFKTLMSLAAKAAI